MKTNICVLVLSLLILLSPANSQTVDGKLSDVETANANLVVAMLNELKSKTTVKLKEHAGKPVAKEEQFYKDLIAKYADESKLRQLFEKDTSHMFVDESMDFYRHNLYGLDFALDRLSPDKVLIRSASARKGETISSNSVDLILVIEGKEIGFMNFANDNNGKRFTMIQFLGYDDAPGIADFWKGAQ